jgi:hypothetical protein
VVMVVVVTGRRRRKCRSGTDGQEQSQENHLLHARHRSTFSLWISVLPRARFSDRILAGNVGTEAGMEGGIKASGRDCAAQEVPAA